MSEDSLSIGDLADRAGLTRRAVRFYVQQKLLPPPAGVGRGNHYSREHLDRLRRIHELQSAGHSLEEIRQIFGGREVPVPIVARKRVQPLVAAELWTRLAVCDGIELHFDARKFAPAAQDLARLRNEIRRTFGTHVSVQTESEESNESKDQHTGDDDASH